MVKTPLSGLDIGKVGMVLFWGYIAFLIITLAAQSFGWIDPKANLGFGFILLIAGLGIALAYIIIVTKRLILSFNEFLAVIVVSGILIAILVFLPQFAPDTFSTSLQQFQIAVMGAN